MIFQLFDSVKLTEEISLEDGDSVPVGTLGAIVEVLKEGEAYIVELFGGLVKYDDQENFVPASRSEKGAFVESIGIETVYPHQIELCKPAREMVSL